MFPHGSKKDCQQKWKKTLVIRFFWRKETKNVAKKVQVNSEKRDILIFDFFFQNSGYTTESQIQQKLGWQKERTTRSLVSDRFIMSH